MKRFLTFLMLLGLTSPLFAQGFANGNGYDNGLNNGGGSLANVTALNGNIGIGSTNPGQLLDVQGTVRAKFFVGDGSGITGIGGSISGLTTGFIVKATGATTIGNSSVMKEVSGNIGIGSVTPGQLLDVQGTVRAIAVTASAANTWGAPSTPTFNAGGTTTCDWSVSNSCIVTATGSGTTIALTNPRGGGPYFLGLCNDTSIRTWTLPSSLKQSTSPAVASACTYTEYFYDGTNYQGGGSSETAAILRGAERAAPAAPTSGGAFWFDSSDHDFEYQGTAGVFFKGVLDNIDSTPVTGQNIATSMTLANAASTGTTLNKLVKLTGAPSTGVLAATTDTSGIIGMCFSGCGTTGSAVVQNRGQVFCIFDGATTAGDYVSISSTSAGACHDNGSTLPTSGQILGRVLSTNVGAGTYKMDFAELTQGSSAGGSGTVNSGTAGNVAYYASSTTAVSTNSNMNLVGANVGIGTDTTPDATLEITHVTGSNSFSVSSTASTSGDTLIVTDGGNVGIGSATPGQLLDVQGTVRAIGLQGRFQPAITTTASASTVTPSCLTDDIDTVTAQAAAITFANHTGTCAEGQKLMIRIKDNGTARGISFGTEYRASSDLALPTTTIISKTLYIGFVWNNVDSKFDLVSLLNNF